MIEFSRSRRSFRGFRRPVRFAPHSREMCSQVVLRTNEARRRCVSAFSLDPTFELLCCDRDVTPFRTADGATHQLPARTSDRENAKTGREKQSRPGVAWSEAGRLRFEHAAGETRRRTRTKRCGAAKVTPRPWSGVTGATGKPRASGRSEDWTGILRDRRAVLRTAGLNPRKVFSETRGCDFRIAHLRSELGPRLDPERTRVPRGLRLRPRLPRGFLVWLRGATPAERWR